MATRTRSTLIWLIAGLGLAACAPVDRPATGTNAGAIDTASSAADAAPSTDADFVDTNTDVTGMAPEPYDVADNAPSLGKPDDSGEAAAQPAGAGDLEAAADPGAPADDGSSAAAAPVDVAPAAPAGPRLPDLGAAPELVGAPWLNTDEPLGLDALRGKVVLVEFWTLGCFNCRNVLPHVADWHARYGGEAFEVVGVHYPEYDYERDLGNVRGAVAELGVHYPVAVDNEGTTWRAWDQRYWPTLYLVDHQGRIRYSHIGEGGYEATEAAIQALIAEAAEGA